MRRGRGRLGAGGGGGKAEGEAGRAAKYCPSHCVCRRGIGARSPVALGPCSRYKQVKCLPTCGGPIRPFLACLRTKRVPCPQIQRVTLRLTHLEVCLPLRRVPQRGHVVEGVVVAERLDLSHLAKPLQRPPARRRGRAYSHSRQHVFGPLPTTWRYVRTLQRSSMSQQCQQSVGPRRTNMPTVWFVRPSAHIQPFALLYKALHPTAPTASCPPPCGGPAPPGTCCLVGEVGI